jgi:hypothetical protein
VALLLFIDFRKAFDLVDAELLLLKLVKYGFSNNAINLIANYFQDRSQTVKYNSKLTDYVPTDLGVPQGSVLGPLFFLIFINDLAFIIELSCKMFADDTTLYSSDENVEKLIGHFKAKTLVLIEWCKMNRLDLNWSKTFFMFVTSKRSQSVGLPKTIKMDGVDIQAVQSFKLLGVTLDTQLSFSKYANDIKLIAIRKMYSIKRLFFLSLSVKVQFLKSFILPYFDYCMSLLIYYPKQTIQKLNNSYNFCIKKLLKINLEDKAPKDDESESKQQDDEDQVIKFNKSIKPFKLFSFQHRVINNLMNLPKKSIHYREHLLFLKPHSVAHRTQATTLQSTRVQLGEV